MKWQTQIPDEARAFTLVEVVVSLAVSSIILIAIVWGYILLHREATRSAYSMAAHQLALQRAEQTMGAKWDLQAFPVVDEVVTNYFSLQVAPLNLPAMNGPQVFATNLTTISLISTSPAVKLVRVDCVWSFPQRGLFTNSVVTYRGLVQ